MLSWLFREVSAPPDTFWDRRFVSSRLLEYETVNRIHARGSDPALLAAARQSFEGIAFAELSADVLARALEPFPKHLRTLDSLHLATLVHLRGQGVAASLATLDKRLAEVATALGFQTLTDSNGATSTLTSTRHHPYWNATRKLWTDAAELR